MSTLATCVVSVRSEMRSLVAVRCWCSRYRELLEIAGALRVSDTVALGVVVKRWLKPKT